MGEKDLIHLIKTGRERKAKVMSVIEIVNQNASIVESIVDKLVKDYSDGLDEFNQKMRTLLEDVRKGHVKTYSQLKLEMHVLELASLMYDAADGTGVLGGQADAAAAYKQEVMAKIYSDIKEGTIPDKQNATNEKAVAEILAAKIMERAASNLRVKVKSANRILEALKKVLTSRIVQQEVWRKEAPIHDDIHAHDEFVEADAAYERDELND